MIDIEGLSHEIWALAQLAPNEGIEDGVARIKEVIEKLVNNKCACGTDDDVWKIINEELK